LASHADRLGGDNEGVLDRSGFQTKAQAGANMKRLTAKVTDTSN
jgi:hypothetical protein